MGADSLDIEVVVGRRLRGCRESRRCEDEERKAKMCEGHKRKEEESAFVRMFGAVCFMQLAARFAQLASIRTRWPGELLEEVER